ncbi:MAG: alpha/beta hydrolase [Chloroflexi bacterium]|nr:alpha/beta hydrolase [Chloroflexota bacterium]
MTRRYFAGCHVFALDLRGHGLSVHPPRPYRSQDFVDDAVATVRWIVQHHGTCTVIGHSLGAIVAAGIAVQAADTVANVVLVDPPWAGPGPIIPYISDILESLPRGEQAVMEVVRRYQPELGELLSGVQARMWLNTAPGVLETILITPEDVFVLPTLLPGVLQPVLVLAADPSLDARISPDQVQHIIHTLPQVKVVTVAGSGHVIHAQKPKQFADAVLDFLGAG